MQSISSDILAVFVITATFDFFMNILPPPVGAVLTRPYFNEHTVLSATLIAGFIGAITYLPLLLMGVTQNPSYYNILVIFLVSAFIGFPMEWSKIFPILQKYYYDALPRHQTFLADGLSGVMVAFVFWIIKSKYDHSIIIISLLSVIVYFILLKMDFLLWSTPEPS